MLGVYSHSGLTGDFAALYRLYEHSKNGQQLALLREVDLCVVGVCSMAFGGPHHTSLAVGSFEATTHLIDFPQALLTSSEPHDVSEPLSLPCNLQEML